MLDRRRFVGSLAAAGTLAALGTRALAQADAFPTKPIRIVWPFAAGGAGSTVARLMGDEVAKILGQPVIVEEKSGANGALGVRAVIQAEPDGYTILQISAANAILPLLQKGVYDLLGTLTPLVGIGTVPYAFVVNAASPIRSFDDLARIAKADGVRYGSGGLGTLAHLGPAKLAAQMGFPATHIPYRGLAAAVQGVLSNEVEFACPTVIDVAQLAATGQLRILAVAADRRIATLPDVPTMAELGFAGYDISTYYDYLAPARTPAPVLDRLTGALTQVANDPNVQDRLRGLGIVVGVQTPQEATDFIRSEVAKWGKVIEANNITLN